jgi:hypothetical protein
VANQHEVTDGFTEINQNAFGMEPPTSKFDESWGNVRGHSEANPQAASGLHEEIER